VRYTFVGGGDGNLGCEDNVTGVRGVMPVFCQLNACFNRRQNFLNRGRKPIEQGGGLHVGDLFVCCRSCQAFLLSGQRHIDGVGVSGCQRTVCRRGFDELLMVGSDFGDLPSHRFRMPPYAADHLVNLRWA
jgi:hypothetical protein